MGSWAWGAATLLALTGAMTLLTMWRGRCTGKGVCDGLVAEWVERFREQNVYYGSVLAMVGMAVFVSGTGREPSPDIVPFLVCACVALGWGVALGQLPLMRRLQKEVEPVRCALLDSARCFAAFWLSTLAVLVLPYVCSAAGAMWWVPAIGLGGFVLVVSWSGPRAIWALLGARELELGAVRDGLARVEAEADCVVPRSGAFMRASGGLANAYAMPGRVSATVLFTRRLLVQLRPEEVAALYAHELSHLEEGGTVGVGKTRAFVVFVVALGAMGGASLEAWREGASVWLLWIWPLLLGALSGLLSLGSKKRESHCDRRGVEMTGGDAEPLMHALQRLHELNFIPRRVAAGVEKVSSHPSLARRLRDLRRMSGEELPPVAPFSLPIGAGKCAAELTEHAVRWRVGARAGACEYGELRELRVRIRRGKPVLRFCPKKGRVREIEIPADLAGEVQRALDRVDAFLGWPEPDSGGQVAAGTRVSES